MQALALGGLDEGTAFVKAERESPKPDGSYTRTPFANNRIPANMINPIAAKMVSLQQSLFPYSQFTRITETNRTIGTSRYKVTLAIPPCMLDGCPHSS